MVQNIVLIEKDKKYNDKISDAIYSKYKALNVQHLSWHAISAMRKDPLSDVSEKCLYELLVRQDIARGRIALRDLSPFEGWRFVLRQTESGGYYLMEVLSDSGFSVEEMSLDGLCGVLPDVRRALRKGVSTDMLFALPDGTVYSIENTGLRIMPDEPLENRKDSARTLRGFIGVWHWRDADGSLLYSAGYYDKGDVRSQITHFPNVRRVIKVSREEADLDMSSFAELLKADFVRAGEITVVPFVYKYLREHMSAD